MLISDGGATFLSELAHWLGLFGEVLNFGGATVLALDLFLRKREALEKEELSALSQWAKQHSVGALYKGMDPRHPMFITNLLARRTKKLAYLGWGLLLIGFSLLAAYHGLELSK